MRHKHRPLYEWMRLSSNIMTEIMFRRLCVFHASLFAHCLFLLVILGTMGNRKFSFFFYVQLFFFYKNEVLLLSLLQMESNRSSKVMLWILKAKCAFFEDRIVKLGFLDTRNGNFCHIHVTNVCMETKRLSICTWTLDWSASKLVQSILSAWLLVFNIPICADRKSSLKTHSRGLPHSEIDIFALF